MKLNWIPALLLLVPLVGAASTTVSDSHPDSFSGHIGVTSATITSDGIDVTYVVNIDAFSTSQPRTEYYLNVETEDYRSIWMSCYVEGTGTGYSTSCNTTEIDSPTPTVVWDTYYLLGVPLIAAHRLDPLAQVAPLTYSPIPHVVVFDDSAGTIGVTMSYADQGFSAGENVLLTVFGAKDDTDRDYSIPQQWIALA